MHVEGLVRGDGPRSRRPNDDIDGLIRLHREVLFDAGFILVAELEGDVDFVGLGVLIFDFGFGQRRLAVKAPVDGL